MRLSQKPEGDRKAPNGLGRLKTAAAASVLALAGTVATKADAQTRYDLPLNPEGGYSKLNKLENPNVVQLSYGGIDGNGYGIDFNASRQGDSVVLSQLSGVQSLPTLEAAETRLLVSDGIGCQNEIIPSAPDEFGQLNTLLNGVPVWRADCDQEIRNTFSGKDGKVGFILTGPFGSAGNMYANNPNGILFDFDPNSNDWCADYNAMIAGQNPLNNGISDRTLATRMDDFVRVDGAIRIINRMPNANSGAMPDGWRYLAQDASDTGAYRYFQSYDNGNTYVLDPQQVSGGLPVPAADYAGVDLTGAQGLRNVVLTYGAVDGQPGGLPGFDAHEKVVAADGTVTLVRLPVIIREGFLDPAQRDMDGDGTPDHQDAIPGANTPGGDLNRFSDAICHISNPENQIGNGAYGCEFKAGVVPPAGTNTVMATPEGSRVFTDGLISANLNNGVLTVGNVSGDAQNPSTFEWHHAYDVSSGLPPAPSPNITFEAPPAGKGYVVEVDLKSNIGLDGQPHNVQVMNDPSELLNQIPLVLENPTGNTPARYEFAPETNPVFALYGTILAVKAYTQDIELPVDASVPDAAIPDAAQVDAMVADAGVDAELDAGAALADAAVDAEVDANVVVIPPVLDAGVVDAQEVDAQVVDAQELDAAVLPEDAAVLPVDAAVQPIDAAPLPVDAAPLPVDMAPIPVDAAVLPVDAAPNPIDSAVQTPDAAVVPVDAGTATPDGAVVQADVAPNCEVTGEEICDGHDNDCNGQVDDNIAPVMLLNEPDPCNPEKSREKHCVDGKMQTVSPSCQRDAGSQPNAIDAETVDPSVKPDAGAQALNDAGTPAENGGSAGGCSTVPGQNGLNGLPFVLAAAAFASRRRENRRDSSRVGGRRATDTQEA